MFTSRICGPNSATIREVTAAYQDRAWRRLCADKGVVDHAPHARHLQRHCAPITRQGTDGALSAVAAASAAVLWLSAAILTTVLTVIGVLRVTREFV